MAVIGKASTTLAEVVVAGGPARALNAEVGPGVSQEALVGDRYGKTLIAEASGVVADQVVGEQYGRNIRADMATVVLEVLIAERNARVSLVTADVIVSLAEPIRPIAQVYQLREQALRSVMRANPPTVLSDMISGNLREQVLQGRGPSEPRSPMFAATLRQAALARRLTVPAGEVRSPILVGTLRQLTTRSRALSQPSVSAVYVRAERMQALQGRLVAAPSTVRSNVSVGTARELVLQSRVAVARDIDDQVATLRQAVVQRRVPVEPIGLELSAQLRELVVQRRVINLAVLDQVGALRQLAVQQRQATAPADVLSPTGVGALSELAVQRRQPAVPQSAREAATLREQVLQLREVPDPAHILGWSAYTARQAALQGRLAPTPPSVHSTTTVGALRVQYHLGRTTVPPIEVIDPSVGRHVGALHHLSVMSRNVAAPPDLEKQRRTVFSVATLAAQLDASFEPPPTEPPEPIAVVATSVLQQTLARDLGPWVPVSQLKLQQAAQQAVLDDSAGWADPTVPNSMLNVTSLATAVALGDELFPPSYVPQSAVQVDGLTQHLALGDDSFPPGDKPQSVLGVNSVGQQAVLPDTAFPPGDQPQSAVVVGEVAQQAVKRDLTISGTLPVSPTVVTECHLALIIRDLSLNYLPVRARGPRPRVYTVRS